MKTLLLSVLISLSFSAQASFYQSNCSNPQATIVYANGHVQNFLKVATVGDRENKLHSLDLSSLKTKTIEDNTLNTESSCRGNFYQKKSLSLKKLQFSKNDGSEFEKDFFGLTKNRKIIEVTYLCEFTMNSRANCSN